VVHDGGFAGVSEVEGDGVVSLVRVIARGSPKPRTPRRVPK
jgi:hypothetical protein